MSVRGYGISIRVGLTGASVVVRRPLRARGWMWVWRRSR